MEQSLDLKIATRLKNLRVEHEFSLEQLAQQCGISRATLSRLENAEVSPTAHILGKLCAVYTITLSRLMSMVEAEFAPLVEADQMDIWQDSETGFTRKIISPPSDALTGEMLECFIPQGQKISYQAPPRLGLEHHLYMLEGTLEVSIDGKLHKLKKGDCLRYQLYTDSQFQTAEKQSATYILTLI